MYIRGNFHNAKPWSNVKRYMSVLKRDSDHKRSHINQRLNAKLIIT